MPKPNRPRHIGGETNLAIRIERERRARGLSYEALARQMTDTGCSIQGSALYKIEKGYPPRKVSVDELIALSQVFGVDVDDLLTPVEVLDQKRARELLAEMDEADRALGADVQRVISVYSEFLELSASEPELYEYVRGHHFGWPREPRPRPADRELTPLFELEGVPDYDALAFTHRFVDFYNALIEEAGKVVAAQGNARKVRGE